MGGVGEGHDLSHSTPFLYGSVFRPLLRWHSPQLVKSLGGGQDGTPVRSGFRSRFRGNGSRSAGPGTRDEQPDRTSETTPTRSRLRDRSKQGGPSDLDPDLEPSPFQPANPVSGALSLPPDCLSPPPPLASLPPVDEPLQELCSISEASDCYAASPDLPDLDLPFDADPWNRTLWDSAAAAPAWEQKPLQV